MLGSLVLALAMLEFSLLLATPFILLSAPFRPGHIRSDYAAVFRWWKEMTEWTLL